ncbi:hypothetical protein AN214_04367 [Pseudoalteromonas sp. P1-9]|uniref:hypothetical protein n=1 Tax=Pseudoalteromonas sp. P1-9 TaxID=1710354 RepID=UPI0006D5E0C8|nr:hypothetical protein [Pseudoalteromonas sp. P1-9]KPV93599.1 hypothetical protein AN214_04367 [Pseudoalteromonas sp. P1-9]
MSESGFDHTKSSTVDVVKHSYGEFIQVWDAPFKTPGRKIILTYVRKGTEISNISKFEYPESGEFSRVVIRENQVEKQYREHKRKYRVETLLPNGNVLVSDELKGLFIDSIFSEHFDFEKLSPTGKKLGDKAVMKKQTQNQRYFVSTYQKIDDKEPKLVKVEEYLGKNKVQTKLIHSPIGN